MVEMLGEEDYPTDETSKEVLWRTAICSKEPHSNDEATADYTARFESFRVSYKSLCAVQDDNFADLVLSAILPGMDTASHSFEADFGTSAASIADTTIVSVPRKQKLRQPDKQKRKIEKRKQEQL